MKRSPAAAFWLSLIPGVGHVYLGQTGKGLVIIALVAGCIQLASRGADAFGIITAFIWVAAMVDARQSALEINHRIETGREPVPQNPSLDFRKWWGWALIGLGVLLGLENFDWFDFDWFDKLWPLGFIALGVYILRQPFPIASTEAPSPRISEPSISGEPPEPLPPEDADVSSEPTHE